MAPPKPHRLVLKYRNYAWIEHVDPRDGSAFCRGMKALGWDNLAEVLPLKNAADTEGRRIDAAHPLLPIRWKNNGLLILPYPFGLPNEDPPIKKDPLAGESTEAAVRDNCAFLCRWTFCPGVKKSGELVAGPGADKYADIVVVSGHGSSMSVWAEHQLGMKFAELAQAAAIPEDLDYPKYVIFACCSIVEFESSHMWRRFLRRKKPVRAILGYSSKYPGGSVGEEIFTRFAQLLAAAEGGVSILEAWKLANGSQAPWAAILHKEAITDTIHALERNALAPIKADGDLVWFGASAESTGFPVVDEQITYRVRFWMGTRAAPMGREISINNNFSPRIGLIPGQYGAITLEFPPGKVSPDDRIEVEFINFRADRAGFRLDRVLELDLAPQESCSLSLKPESNRLVIKVKAPDLLVVQINYHVLPGAFEAVDRHGMIGVLLHPPKGPTVSFKVHGAYILSGH
jgi:hypothetical protein